MAGATDVIVDGENGYLAKPKNAADLAQKITQLLEMDTQSLSQNAANSVQKFDWQNIAQTYRDKIQSLF